MNERDYYYLGKITRKYSFKGELILFLDTDSPSEYYNLDKIFLKINDRFIPYFISEIYPYKNYSIRVKLEEIDTEIKANSLINIEIYLPINSLPALKGNKFYYHEVEGFKIIDKNIGEIGIIKNINDNSPQHLFVVISNLKEILIPINDTLIESVNRKEKLINMNLPAGLIELYS